MTSYVNPSTRIGGVEQVVVAERQTYSSLEEVPFDDQQYVRVNGEWVTVDFPEIVPDTLAPNPPTALVANGNIASGGNAVNYTLSWTAPTTNTDDTPLTDLAYYVVRWRYAGGGAWTMFVSNDTSTLLPGLRMNASLEWSVLARDYSGNDSSWADSTADGVVDTVGPERPSPPVLTSRLGTITATWDGLDHAGAVQPVDFDHLEFFESATTGGPWNYVDQVGGAGSAYITSVPVGQLRYVTTVAVDTSGNTSLRSVEVSILVEGIKSPDIDTTVFDSIDADIATAKAESALTAQEKADLAKAEAIAEAATDAQTKADLAEAAAINAAASDATSKASTAKTEAIAEAATDAQTKADAAKTEAIAAAAATALPKIITVGTNKTFLQPFGYEQKTPNLVGSIVIDTPITFSNYMSTFTLRGYNYATATATIDLTIAAYVYSTGAFLSHGQSNVGTAAVTARLAKKTSTGKVSIILDIAGGTWQYPKILVERAELGYTLPPDSFGEGWSASVPTDLTGYEGIMTPTKRDLSDTHTLTQSWRTTGQTTIDGGKITADSVTASQIAANAITAVELNADAVVARNIKAGEVVAGKLAVDAVVAANIAAGAVTADEIAANAITTAKLDALAVTAAKIAANAVEADKILAGAVIAGKIATDAIAANNVQAGAIIAGKLAVDAVLANNIKAGEVTAGKLGVDSVLAANIKAGEIVAGKLGAGAVEAGNVAANAIQAGNIEAGAVTTNTLDAGAVTAVKLAANAVEADKIAATAIDGKTITGAKIRTAESGQRTEIGLDLGQSNRIDFYSGRSEEVYKGGVYADASQSGSIILRGTDMGAGAADLLVGSHIWGPGDVETAIDAAADVMSFAAPDRLDLASGGSYVTLQDPAGAPADAGIRLDSDRDIDIFSTLTVDITGGVSGSPEGQGWVRVDSDGLKVQDGHIVADSMRPMQNTGDGMSTSTALISERTSGGMVFTAPPSGAIWVTVGGFVRANTAGQATYASYRLRTGSTIGSGTMVQDQTSGRAFGNYNTGFVGGSWRGFVQLTAGAVYNLVPVFAATGAGGGNFSGVTCVIEPSM